MKLFNLENGLNCVQSGVFLIKFGQTLLLTLSAQPDNVWMRWKNNCKDAPHNASKYLQTPSHF